MTTFLAMVYILFTLLYELNLVWNEVRYLATNISAAIATLNVGLVANVPFAQVTAIGLNAFLFIQYILLLHSHGNKCYR